MINHRRIVLNVSAGGNFIGLIFPRINSEATSFHYLLLKAFLALRLFSA